MKLNNKSFYRSETFFMDDLVTVFLKILFSYPHCLESRQRTQDGASDPWQKLTLGRTHNANLSSRRNQNVQLLGDSLSHSREHGITST